MSEQGDYEWYDDDDAGEPDWDGDPCPNCGSNKTMRLDVIGHDPDIWACDCAACGATFEVLDE